MGIVEIVTLCNDTVVLEHIAGVLVNERLPAAAHVKGPLHSV